jgi:2-dehydropantoate 2-reductase
MRYPQLDASRPNRTLRRYRIFLSRKSKMKVLILGAGGVGGYFGSRLIEAGADITFLVREKRQQFLQERGLEVESPHGNLRLKVQTITAQTVRPSFDLILLAPKAYDLDSSLSSLENAIGKDTVLLPFLNGMAHISKLDARYGARRVMAGVAHIAAELTDAGVVRQLASSHSLTFGSRDPAHESIARCFFTLCQRSKFDTIYSESVQEVLWTKWTFLATLAAATTMCRGSAGQIMATKGGAQLIRKMYTECLSVAAMYGFPISGDARQKALAVLTQSGSHLTASMLRDLLSGHRTEHDHILGEMVRMAEAKNMELLLISAACCHMEVETGA